MSSQRLLVSRSLLVRVPVQDWRQVLEPAFLRSTRLAWRAETFLTPGEYRFSHFRPRTSSRRFVPVEQEYDQDHSDTSTPQQFAIDRNNNEL
jgi:hypothetical protein